MQLAMLQLRERIYIFLSTKGPFYDHVSQPQDVQSTPLGWSVFTSTSRELHHGWGQAVFLRAGEPGGGARLSCAGLAGCRQGSKPA